VEFWGQFMRSSFLFATRRTHLTTHQAVRVLLLLLAGLALGLNSRPVGATGSASYHPSTDTGNRAWLEFITGGAGSTTAGIQRASIIQVYALPGETLYLGSSAVGVGGGVINYRDPTGAAGTCGATGLITTRAQELAGPAAMAAGGYPACAVVVGAAQGGIWEIDFVSPNAGGGGNNNPPVTLANAQWLQNDATRHSTAAWDVTVQGTDGLVRTGRVFADYLALNMGGLGSPAAQVQLDAVYYILTRDGYLYQIDLNGMNPFGFIFFANNKGFQNSGTGNALYRSVQLSAASGLQGTDAIHDPGDPDDATNTTHKIFFEVPSAELPVTSGTDWLLQPTPITPPAPTNFTFTGDDGTPGQFGSGRGGTFNFDVPPLFAGSFAISIDLTGDGDFDDPQDRAIIGQAISGATNTVTWDGLDGQGNPIAFSSILFQAAVTLNGGEVHFPFLDVETNPAGLRIARMSAATGAVAPVNWDVYYDDSAAVLDPVAADQIATTPRSALLGIDSMAGAHAFNVTPAGSISNGYGNIKGIDTWAYVPGPPAFLAGGFNVAEADLAIDKVDLQDPVLAGGVVGYNITVTNNGPSNAVGATVSDGMPGYLLNVTWFCTPGAGASCTASGTGSIADTVTIPAGGQIVYTISATVGGAAPNPMQNTAVVTSPPDVTDPNPGNNTDIETTSLTTGGADLELSKAASVTSAAIGDTVVYTLSLQNNGPDDATNVTVSDPMPANLQFVSASGAYNPGTGIWTVGTLTAGNTTNLNITATIIAGGNAVNTAQVASSDQPDPDSTPGNNIASEDDQASWTIAIPGGSGSSGGPGGPGTGGSGDPLLAGNTVAPNPYISKGVSTPFALPGETIRYTITITNPDSTALTGLTMTDTLPAEIEPLSANASSGTVTISGQQITLQAASLAPNGQITITVNARIRDSAVTPYALTNTACLTAPVSACAQATVLSVSGLPQTGQSPWSPWRVPLLALLAGAVALTGISVVGSNRLMRGLTRGDA